MVSHLQKDNPANLEISSSWKYQCEGSPLSVPVAGDSTKLGESFGESLYVDCKLVKS